MNVQMEEGWKEVLKDEFAKDYFNEIASTIRQMKAAGHIIYPPGPLIFNAFRLTPWNEVRVVILGQDPYHGAGEAMGLCFSVPKGIKVPPSLKNIFKEIQEDLAIAPPSHGDLTEWAQQGILLLNASLTVEKDKPNSHKSLGWHRFTDRVIQVLSDHKTGLVFLLWGNYAKSKKILIDSSRHLILESPHPSPLAGGGFFGHHHFSKTNQYFKNQGLEPIRWQLH